MARDSGGELGIASEFRNQFRDIVDRNTLYLFLLFLARFLGCYVNKVAFRLIGIRMSSRIRFHYLVSLFGQSIHVLDSMPPGTAAGTITTTANTLQLGISEKLGVFIEFLTTTIGSLIVAFIWDWRLTLVVCSSVVFIILSFGILMPLILKREKLVNAAKKKSASIASESFSAIKMVMACGAESRMAKKYAYWVQEQKRRGISNAPLLALQLAIIVSRIPDLPTLSPLG